MSFSKRTVVAGSVVALSVGTGLVPIAAYAVGSASTHPGLAAGVVADASSAGSEADASAIARAHNHVVVVDSETTPTSQISALPNGSFQYEADSVPVRVKRNGAWGKIDTALTRLSDGLWAPTASAAQVRFGSGGSNVLDKVQTAGGDWVTETWPYGNLPTPSVSGSTATYADVLPGVDVRLTATASGMSDVLVIDSATAASNPKLQSLSLPVSGATMAAGTADTAKARAADGSAVVSASPLWWDSSDGSSAKGPHGDAPVRPLQHSTDAHGVTMNIASTIAAAKPMYPVFVDPDWSTGANAYWFTDAAYPNQSYLNGNYADGIQAVGVYDPYRSDMFWQFPMGAVAYKHILSAVVDTTQVWAGTCSLSPISVHLYGNNGPQPVGFTWNQEQSWSGQWWGAEDDQNPTAGCPGQGAGAVGWNVTPGVALYAEYADPNIQFGWTYDNPNSNYSRRHYSQSAALIVTYNTPPNTPTNPVMTSPPRGCESSTSPTAVNGNEPITLQVYVTDPDAGQLVNTAFYVADGSTLAQVWRGGVPDQAQGNAAATVPAGTLSNGKTYAWRTQSGDEIDLSPGFSPWCYFTVDDVAPVVPVLPAGPIKGLTVGTAASVAVTPGGAVGDAAEFEVWVRPGTASSTPPVPGGQTTLVLPACGAVQGGAVFVCPGSGGTATASVAPVDVTSTVWATAIDAAGNMSAPVGVELDAAGASEAGAHGWHLQSYAAGALPTTLTDDNTAAGSGLASEADLAVGNGIDPTRTDTVPTAVSASDVLSLSGLVLVTRQYNGTYHGANTEGDIMPGYHHEVGEDGQILPVSSGGVSPWGGSTIEIYLCTFPDGQTMLSSNSGCEGTGASATPIGYSFSSQPTAFGVTSEHIYRCTLGADHMTTISPTCEGWNKPADGQLGWFLTSGTIHTAAQAIDTTKSFTVSAWVKPAIVASPMWHTILAESGPASSGFYLQEDNSGHFQFCLNAQTANPTMVCARASDPVTAGKWMLVTGIYDPANQQVRLVLGGTLTGSSTVATRAPVSGEVSANGPITVGSAETQTLSVDQWDGYIADPVAIPAVIDSAQLTNLYYETPID
ncbi:LamG-like jellyroll fold domain-containing protein [Humibacter ginsengisoli]